MNETYNKIVSTDDVQELLGIKNQMFVEKMKLDKFFSMFLENFDRKIYPNESDTPILKLYNIKLKEYSDIDKCIKAATYYANKRSANI
jgi:hypothetical protein